MKYGEILPEGFDIPSSAFWLQKDLTIDGNPFKLVNILPGDRVMDCGGFIGTWTAACLEQGAAHATVYEAAPKNALVLKPNLEKYGKKVSVVEAALVPGHEDTITLEMSGFSGTNSIISTGRKAKCIDVPAINFRESVLTVNPTVIKLDVEGAEYSLLNTLKYGDLKGVRTLFIEFHPIENRDVLIANVAIFLAAEGFQIISTRKRAFIATREPQKQVGPVGLF